MNEINTPRIVVCGTSQQGRAGLVALALAQELQRQGLGVSVCVVGAQLHAAALLQSLTGRYVPCLERRLLTPAGIKTNVYLAGLGADIVLIVSEMGLYDGVGSATLLGSPAEIAWLLQAPVLLCADTQGCGNSIAALLKGYQDLADGFTVAGLALNRFGADPATSPLSFYQECLQGLPLPPLWGGLSFAAAQDFVLPQGIGQCGSRMMVDHQFLLTVAGESKENFDWEALLAAARQAPTLAVPDFSEAPAPPQSVWAVAADSCFGLCFQENLELLRYHGARLVPFSPLADQSLPTGIRGVYFPGGFVAAYGSDLARNTGLHEELRAFAAQGGLICAEGGGTAYLCQRFEVDASGNAVAGVGVFPGTARLAADPPAYYDCHGTADSLLSRSAEDLPILFDAGWKITGDRIWDIARGEKIKRCLEIKQRGMVTRFDGLAVDQRIFGTFGFLNFTVCPELPRRLAVA